MAITDAEKLWLKILEGVKTQVPLQIYTTWFEPTVGESISQNTLWVKVPNRFFVDWIEEHYHSMIYDILKVEDDKIKIRYKLAEQTKETSSTKIYDTDASHLQTRYTFNNFITGASNKFAQAAAMAVASAPGKQYNPLFLYGNVGLGKTHLLQAIGNYIKEHTADAKVYYIECESFMNEMVDAIQNNRIMQFKNKYRKKDVLLIDDIQFLEGKEGLQEEIFHTFNFLYDAGKQIALSSDRPPQGLANLEERLVSRFQGGLVCDIQSPNIEMRVAILKKKIATSKSKVPDEVINYIAEQFSSNIRELEGALVKILALSTFTNETINLNTTKELLKDMVTIKKIITIDVIKKVVASYYNISLASLKSNRRMQSIVKPRNIAIYLAREYTHLSLVDIGEAFGGKNHATILHSYNQIVKLLNKEEEKKELSNILKLLTTE
ncbi:MAG: chromosomal replication initiator protein DnaA [bacterium]|nr:chromosomal replication initiator protein DnaA [bacterium]